MFFLILLLLVLVIFVFFFNILMCMFFVIVYSSYYYYYFRSFYYYFYCKKLKNKKISVFCLLFLVCSFMFVPRLKPYQCGVAYDFALRRSRDELWPAPFFRRLSDGTSSLFSLRCHSDVRPERSSSNEDFHHDQH